ncbi:hypothetical protein KIPB_004247 [Kipferlia bialata]|uniref:Uncharacterized protein n=1 Tax=Kipferlia bialata TaxID=797122 RepID=A0A391NTF8_9EUKA|nr:hypothetical protein KIPB_004247 [Kipferlia bialata]|eukprot:g4247.t1
MALGVPSQDTRLNGLVASTLLAAASKPLLQDGTLDYSTLPQISRFLAQDPTSETITGTHPLPLDYRDCNIMYGMGEDAEPSNSAPNRVSILAGTLNRFCGREGIPLFFAHEYPVQDRLGGRLDIGVFYILEPGLFRTPSGPVPLAESHYCIGAVECAKSPNEGETGGKLHCARGAALCHVLQRSYMNQFDRGENKNTPLFGSLVVGLSMEKPSDMDGPSFYAPSVGMDPACLKLHHFIPPTATCDCSTPIGLVECFKRFGDATLEHLRDVAMDGWTLDPRLPLPLCGYGHWPEAEREGFNDLFQPYRGPQATGGSISRVVGVQAIGETDLLVAKSFPPKCIGVSPSSRKPNHAIVQLLCDAKGSHKGPLVPTSVWHPDSNVLVSEFLRGCGPSATHALPLIRGMLRLEKCEPRVYHNDLHLGNVICMPDGTVRFVDFDHASHKFLPGLMGNVTVTDFYPRPQLYGKNIPVMTLSSNLDLACVLYIACQWRPELETHVVSFATRSSWLRGYPSSLDLVDVLKVLLEYGPDVFDLQTFVTGLKASGVGDIPPGSDEDLPWVPFSFVRSMTAKPVKRGPEAVASEDRERAALDLSVKRWDSKGRNITICVI